MLLAKITGSCFINMPYINHKNTPTKKTEKVTKDKSSVRFVLIIFISWGRKESVQSTPAIIPSIKVFVSKLSHLYGKRVWYLLIFYL